MAQIRVRQKQPPLTIDRFLGINEDVSGETQIEVGESPFMRNFRITESYKLRKRDGYSQLFDTLGNFPVHGMWYGKINGTFYYLFACNGKIYKTIDGVNTEIGTLTDAKTFFFYESEKVYIMNGSEYKSWDGTTFTDIVGYRPIIATGTPPSGGGTLFEQSNLLTGKKSQEFSGDNVATTYQLAETSIDSVDEVIVNGTTKTEVTHYSKDLTTGKITFTTAPDDSTPNNVLIKWTKTNGSDRALITKCMFSMLFGGANDSRIHAWGNPDRKNTRFTSGIPFDGSPTSEYFPALDNYDIGSDEYAITDIVRQYDRQLIFTEKGTFFSYYELVSDSATFPVFPLNSNIGNVAPNQVQLILNNPYTVYNGVYEWIATSVRDERNATYISKKVQPSLDEVTLENAITYDFEAKGEYWLCVGSTVWVFNYRNGTWYVFDNIDSTCFIEIDKELYFGTSTGQIMKLVSNLRTDNQVAINAIWNMNFHDFNTEWLKKYLSKMWLTFQPQSGAKATITWETDRSAGNSDTYAISYNLLDFSNIDFNNFSFLTYYNPQPVFVKLKAKKFVYFKLIIECNGISDTLTLLSINLPARLGGEVK